MKATKAWLLIEWCKKRPCSERVGGQTVPCCGLHATVADAEGQLAILEKEHEEMLALLTEHNIEYKYTGKEITSDSSN